MMFMDDLLHEHHFYVRQAKRSVCLAFAAIFNPREL